MRNLSHFQGILNTQSRVLGQFVRKNMIILIHGEDIFRSREKLNELAVRYNKNKSGANFLSIEPENSDWPKIKTFLQSGSLFNEEKFLVLKNVFLNKIDWLSLARADITNFQNDSSVVILFFEEQIVQKQNFVDLVSDKSQILEFAYLRGKALEDWIIKTANLFGGNLDCQGARFLVNCFGNNLFLIKNELMKIIAFDDKPNIDTLKKIVNVKNMEENAFKIIDYAAAGNYSGAIKVLRKRLFAGDNDLALFGLMANQIRNMIILKDLGHVSCLKLHPYVIKKTLAQVQRHNLKDLLKIYSLVSNLDIKIKKHGLPAYLALELIIKDLSKISY